MKRRLLLALVGTCAAGVLLAQTAGTRPVPRFPDGRVNLGSPTGEIGLWVPPNAGDERLVDLDTAIAPQANAFTIESNPLQRVPRFDSPLPELAGLKPKLTFSQVPFQPWSRALFEEHQRNQWEPHTRCKPSGGPRAFLTPYGVELLDMPELQRLYVVDIGGPHTMRVIYTDGRPHPPISSPVITATRSDGGKKTRCSLIPSDSMKGSGSTVTVCRIRKSFTSRNASRASTTTPCTTK